VKQFVFLIALLCSISLFAGNAIKEIVVTDIEIPLNLNEFTYTYATDKRDLALDDVLKVNFNYMPSGVNVGLTDKIYWVAYNFNNRTDNVKEYYIFYPYNHINKIDVFLVSGNSAKHIKSTGSYYSNAEKDLPSRGYPILLRLKPGITKVVLKIDHLYLPLRAIAFLLTKEQVLKNTISTQSLLSLWQGVIIIVLILSFSLFVALKKKTFLYYFIFNVGVLLFFSGETGEFFLLFDTDILNNIIDFKHLANVIILFFLPLFINEIVPISKLHPKLWKAMFFGLAIGPIAWAVCLIPAVKETHFLYYTTLYLIVSSAIIFFLLLYFTFSAYRAKYKNALVVFVIYTIYFTAGFVNLILPNLGWRDSELMVYNSFIFGSLFEIIAFLWIIGRETLTVYLHRSQLIEEQKEHQTQIIKAIVESQEKERNIVGRELHDMIGANISVIMQQIDKNNESLVDIVDKTIDSVRNLSHALVTPLMKEGEFMDEINELCILFSSERIRIGATFFRWSGVKDFEKATHLYRIVQELLKNAVKHSNAKNVTLQFIIDNENELSVMYEDNGKGFDYKEAINNKGLGIINIVNRVRMIDAKIVFDSMKNSEGTTIVITIPGWG